MKYQSRMTKVSFIPSGEVSETFSEGCLVNNDCK